MRQTWSSVCKHILWCPIKIQFLPPLNGWERLRPCAFHDLFNTYSQCSKYGPPLPRKFLSRLLQQNCPHYQLCFPKWSTVYSWWWCSQLSSRGWAFISPFNFSFLPQVPWSCQWTCVNENVSTHHRKSRLHTNTSHCHTNKMLVHTRSWLLRASHSI